MFRNSWVCGFQPPGGELEEVLVTATRIDFFNGVAVFYDDLIKKGMVACFTSAIYVYRANGAERLTDRLRELVDYPPEFEEHTCNICKRQIFKNGDVIEKN